jgi:GGDEF domain-containing protein
MRLYIVLLFFWLLLFFSVERLIETVNIARVAYPIAPVMATVAILSPRYVRAPLWLLLGLIAPILITAKVLAGYQVWGASFPLTVTEGAAIAVTTILAYWVGQGIGEFESAVARITIGPAENQPGSFADGQAEMYREVRRARHHHRPLSLMAIGIEDGSVQVVLDRMVRETQQALMKRYVLSDVARALCKELEDYNLIAQANDHFLVLVPEASAQDVQGLSTRLGQAVSEQVGVTLRIGAASFPDDAVTFESLMGKARAEMVRQPLPKPPAEAQPTPSDQAQALPAEGVVP